MKRVTLIAIIAGLVSAGLVARPAIGAASGRTALARQGEPLPGAHKVQEYKACHGYKTYGVPNVQPLQKSKTYQANISTNKGAIVVTLLPKAAPIAVQSFIFLAQHRYFDGVPFHRVVPGFVIQGGDPTGTGYCGPGYAFKNERVTLPYVRGVVAMANAGPNTNGSQFFIVLSNNTGLPPNYTIFGRVTRGMDAVDRITHVKLGPGSDGANSKPLTRVYMKTVRIKIS